VGRHQDAFRRFDLCAAAERPFEVVISWQDREETWRGLLREVNERIAEVARLERSGRLPFICECGNRDCRQPIELTHPEYEEVRAHARRFALAPDHENPTVEIVVWQNGRFAVAETFVGEASRIPEDTDPRMAALNPTEAAGLEPATPVLEV
jgi:hypothetical protein